MKKVVTVLGGGSFGTALAIVFSEKNLVRLWVRNKKEARKMQKTRENKKHLPGVKIPESVVIFHDLLTALEGTDLIVLAVPSFSLRDALKSIEKASKITGRDLSFLLPPILGLSKGVEKDTMKLPSEMVEDVCKAGKVSYFHLSGPGFAKDIAQGKEVTELLASDSSNKDLAFELQQMLETPKFRVVLSDDLIGVQFGGALKNILTIALAMVEEFSGKDQKLINKLLSLCIEELITVGTSLGSSEEAISSALDDLILTSSGDSLSRNYKIGKMIIKAGIPELRQEIKKKKLTSEGLSSAEAVYQICCERNIEAPIIKEIALTLSEQQTPKEGVENLIKIAKGAH